MSMLARIFFVPIASSNSTDEPIKPNIGTNNESGATVEAGYFFKSEFHTQYPNRVVG